MRYLSIRKLPILPVRTGLSACRVLTSPAPPLLQLHLRLRLVHPHRRASLPALRCLLVLAEALVLLGVPAPRRHSVCRPVHQGHPQLVPRFRRQLRYLQVLQLHPQPRQVPLPVLRPLVRRHDHSVLLLRFLQVPARLCPAHRAPAYLLQHPYPQAPVLRSRRAPPVLRAHL